MARGVKGWGCCHSGRGFLSVSKHRTATTPDPRQCVNSNDNINNINSNYNKDTRRGYLPGGGLVDPSKDHTRTGWCLVLGPTGAAGKDSPRVRGGR